MSIDLDVENEQPEAKELVLVKHDNVFWPAKIVRKIDGEITEIEIFNELKTKKTVEHIKLKPFQKLAKVPKRSKAWKAAYEKAVMELEK